MLVSAYLTFLALTLIPSLLAIAHQKPLSKHHDNSLGFSYSLQSCPILPGFLAQYPKVKIEIDLDNQLVDLHSENVDIAIRIGNAQDSSLNARMLMANQTSLCASAKYLAQFGTPKKPEELLQHNCLLLDRDWSPSLSEQSSGDIYALYRGGKHMRPVIRAFIDYLVKALKL